MRLLLVPLIIYTMLIGFYSWALVLFLIAGISDAVDGYIARKFNQGSELGTYLDPLADKVLLVSSFIVLTYLGHLPLWLTILVVSRDVLIIAGVLLAFIMEKPVEMQPIMISKVNTAAQIIIVLADLVLLAMPAFIPMFISDNLHSTLIIFGSIAVACFTCISTIAYTIEWVRHISES
jgi:cardiolipin synthase